MRNLRRLATAVALALPLTLVACGSGDTSGIGGVVTVLEQIDRVSYGISVLAVNVEGTDTTNGPWQDRWNRIATWMADSTRVPDVLVLQEVTGSKCVWSGSCDPKP